MPDKTPLIDGVPPEEFTGLKLSPPKTVAAGFTAVVKSMQEIWGKAGLIRGTKALTVLNQKGGVDCPSCAWPDPDEHRSFAEFCENGAKAIAWETDQRRTPREFFQKHSIAELAAQSDYWHGQQGRLTEPMVVRPGGTHYEPIPWDDAFALIASELNSLKSPDEADFYTSGRASNEAAFLYQLFVRAFGTNNLPDCSNMCHESSGSALAPTVGIGKGTVKLDDFAKAELILILGQNPGTNHPRMLSALQQAKKAGAKIVAVNPLPEAGLVSFRNPQQVGGMLGFGSELTDLMLPIRINGDSAFLQAVIKILFEKNAIDAAFVQSKTEGIEELRAAVAGLDWAVVLEQTGLTREQIEQAADWIAGSDKIIACWAMGLTQHKNSVGTIRDLLNIILLRGSIGKPGAGLCPVRGHSNVQGDRTMGIWEKPPAWLLENIRKEFGFDPPVHHGHDTVEAIKAMHEGHVGVFFCLGGNFLSATPDTEFTAAALRKCRLTVQVSIKLNRSHLVHGRTALILPCLGRTEADLQGGVPQFVTTENSMGVVQLSQGTMTPASPELLSETQIVARLAKATLGEKHGIDWIGLGGDYNKIRDVISRVIPGFENYNERVRKPGGFYLPNGPRQGEFKTPNGKAKFTVNPLSTIKLESGQLVMMTIRTHDQFNTTIYGLDDRYRGIKHERRVILMNKSDITGRGLKAGEIVDITSHWAGQTRVAHKFIVVEYPIPPKCVATYFPETNVLVPLDSVADTSNTPTSKSVIVSLSKSAGL